MRDRPSSRSQNHKGQSRNMAALNQLCYDGKLDEVRLVLARRGDVNNKDNIGQTGLMRAAIKKHNSIMKLLLDQPGVKINEKCDTDGHTALHRAVAGSNPEGARMLLLHPDMNTANAISKHGETALVKAVKERKNEVLRELVTHGCISLDIGALEGNER